MHDNVQINGVDVRDLPPERVISLLSGAPNTVVSLTVETSWSCASLAPPVIHAGPSPSQSKGTSEQHTTTSTAPSAQADAHAESHRSDGQAESHRSDGQAESHRSVREGDLVTVCVTRRKALVHSGSNAYEQAVGIGLGFARSLSGAFLVTQVLEGSPAAELMRQGKMAVGDRLYAIDGRELQGLHMSEVSSRGNLHIARECETLVIHYKMVWWRMWERRQ
jgi:hypothetical protein